MQHDGQQQIDERTLHRIVTLLFALANLAERAGARCAAVRNLVLWIVRPAEAAARSLVLEAYGPVPLPAPCPVSTDNDVPEALRLATSLRVLAAMLALMYTPGIQCRTHIPVWPRTGSIRRLPAHPPHDALAGVIHERLKPPKSSKQRACGLQDGIPAQLQMPLITI